MKYGLSSTPSLDFSECFAIGVYDGVKASKLYKELDPKVAKLIDRLSARLQKVGDTIWQADVDGHSLLVVNCGKPESFDHLKLEKQIQDIAKQSLKLRFKSLMVCMPPLKDLENTQQVEKMVVSFDAACYQMLDYKSQKEKQHVLEKIEFYMPGADKKAIEAGEAISSGIRLTKNLANRPANDCTPTYLAKQAHELSKVHSNFSLNVLTEKDMKELGMGALLAVSKGSIEPPRLIELSYHGGGDEAPIVLIGKGITFDSGGLSLKPPEAMTEMKYDMGGAASVLGTLKACAELNLPVNVIGLMACAENLPSGQAVKPGDIITTMAGITVEVLNTDAEGRLVLSDALTYAERFNPKMVLDIATLTGAMIIALGSVYTGFMTKDDDVAKAIEQASQISGDKAWRLPLDDAYQKMMDSDIADLSNQASNRGAGSITAACFLSRFTKNYPWAHLDIAGSAWVSGKKCDATGRPVPLLTQLLRHYAANH